MEKESPQEEIIGLSMVILYRTGALQMKGKTKPAASWQPTCCSLAVIYCCSVRQHSSLYKSPWVA